MHFEATGNTSYFTPAVNTLSASATVHVKSNAQFVVMLAFLVHSRYPLLNVTVTRDAQPLFVCTSLTC